MLAPRKRITKRDLKEDKLITFYAQVRNWTENNSKFVFAALAAIVVIIVASVIISQNRKQAEREASVEFAKAVRVYDTGDYQQALTMFNNLVENYGSTDSGTMGRLYLAKCFFKNDDFVNAREQYKKFASSFDDRQHFRAAALAGAASCLEAQEKYAKAAQEYEKIVKKYPDVPLASFYLFKAARCYSLANSKEKAETLYQKIVENYPESEEKDDALLLSSMM